MSCSVEAVVLFKRVLQVSFISCWNRFSCHGTPFPFEEEEEGTMCTKRLKITEWLNESIGTTRREKPPDSNLISFHSLIIIKIRPTFERKKVVSPSLNVYLSFPCCFLLCILSHGLDGTAINFLGQEWHTFNGRRPHVWCSFFLFISKETHLGCFIIISAKLLTWNGSLSDSRVDQLR